MSIEDQIRKDVSENRIMLYMKGTPALPQCGFSSRVVKILKEIGVSFEEGDARYANVMDDPDLREGIKLFSNWPTIPQLYVNGVFIGGCDIVSEMHRAGELKPLVEKAAA